MNFTFKIAPIESPIAKLSPPTGSLLEAKIHAVIIDLWHQYQYLSFDTCLIYGFEDFEERNQTYQIELYAPDYYLIGDGGGQGLFLKRNDSKPRLYCLDLGAIGSAEMKIISPSFLDWLQNKPVLVDDKTDDFLTVPIKVFVIVMPKEKAKFIMAARKAFTLKSSVTEISAGLQNLPYLLVENITLMKYQSIIEVLNAQFNCLNVGK
jgi:hypothetical protein